MNEQKFDPTKPVRTKAGKEAVILETNVIYGGGYTMAVRVKGADGCWRLGLYTPDGKYYVNDRDTPHDLVNIPPEPKRIKREVWLNVYPDRVGFAYSSWEDANKSVGPYCLARIKVSIDCEVGEGLGEKGESK